MRWSGNRPGREGSLRPDARSRSRAGPVMLLVLSACSVIYDDGDFAYCPELVMPTETACAPGVFACLVSCPPEEDCVYCYDANRDGVVDTTEVLCPECIVTSSYACWASAGCEETATQMYCCTAAECDAFLCDDGDQCIDPLVDFSLCANDLPEATCRDASAVCFP